MGGKFELLVAELRQRGTTPTSSEEIRAAMQAEEDAAYAEFQLARRKRALERAKALKFPLVDDLQQEMEDRFGIRELPPFDGVQETGFFVAADFGPQKKEAHNG